MLMIGSFVSGTIIHPILTGPSGVSREGIKSLTRQTSEILAFKGNATAVCISYNEDSIRSVAGFAFLAEDLPFLGRARAFCR